ncbi:MAG: DUF6282 family protein [Synergistaceae bacterium]|jgi:hypothetical protein|nr:DUF6282 family protein [Synergistaceae bacterium]
MAGTIITGAYDMHVHAGPDVLPRKSDCLEFADIMSKAGMAGFVSKNHYFTTSPWAKIANSRNPGFKVIGSITLNNTVGGMNPFAVDIAGRDGAKVVWFPTIDTLTCINEAELMPEGKRPYWVSVLLELKADGMRVSPVNVVDENGKVLPEVIDVLDVIAKHEMILCTGHITVKEAFAVIKAAHERHVDRIICTHCDSPLAFFEIEQQLELVNKYGVYMEHCLNGCTTGKVTWEVCLEQIKKIGYDHVLLSTDLGQVGRQDPNEGLEFFAKWLLENGATENEVRKTIVDNPKKLLGAGF